MSLIIGKIIRINLLAVIMFLAACSGDTPLILDKPIKLISQNLADTVPKLMEAHDVVGLSVAVMRNDQLVLNKHFGFANSESGQKIHSHTVFKAASLGKPVFAYVALVLVEQGILDLDTPLVSYHGEMDDKMDPNYSAITARMVLSHTTGLPNFGDEKQKGFQFTPGSAFHYSGHAYQFLQSTVMSITGKSLNTLAQQYVFSPLLMKRSSYIWKESFRETLAQSYGSGKQKIPVKREATRGFAAWSLYTTIEDYATFVRHLMQTAKTPNSISAQLLTPQVDVADGVKWGLGWGIQNTQPNQSFWHWGSLAGFRHYVVGYPKENVAVIVMSNSANAFKMVETVMRNAIGGEYPSYEWF
jgi:CubicO group peptidase (beta-lactamase class C family)